MAQVIPSLTTVGICEPDAAQTLLQSTMCCTAMRSASIVWCHHLSGITFPLCPSILIQHQRAPVAPAGWPRASHFLSCFRAIQWWRASSGLSGPQGVHQKPALGTHRGFLLNLRKSSEWSTIVLAVIWWPHSTGRQSQEPGPPPPWLRPDYYIFFKHFNSSRKEPFEHW